MLANERGQGDLMITFADSNAFAIITVLFAQLLCLWVCAFLASFLCTLPA